MSRRAMTLAEVVVVSAILLLLLGIVIAFLVPGLRAWTRSDASSRAQQQSLVVIALLTREVQHAKPDTIKVIRMETEDPPGTSVRRDGVFFVSSLDKRGEEQCDSSGDPLWQQVVYVYHQGDSRQVCCQRSPLRPPAPDPPPVVSVSPQPDDRVVARHVTSLRLALSADGSPPLTVRAESTVEGYGSELESAVVPLLVNEPLPLSSPIDH